MARRLRPQLRRTLYALGALFAVCTALLTGAFAATFPQVMAGTDTAKQGAETLLRNPQEAAHHFRQAEHEFTASLAGIQSLPEPAKVPSLIPPFSWGIRLNKAAAYLSRAGGNAAQLAESYQANPVDDTPSTLIAAHAVALDTLTAGHHATLDLLERNLNMADEELAHIPNWIPGKMGRKVAELKRQVSLASTAVPQARSLHTGWQEALGRGTVEPQTALLIFQNDTELRPSGGFMGSYAILTATNGTIRSFAFGKDIYALDQELERRELIPATPYMKTIGAWWGFRDSNVNLGLLPEIGPQIAGFYAKATDIQPRVIIFADLSILENILALTGPLPIPGSDRVVTAENASTELTHVVEKEYWEEEANREANEPKQVLNQMIPLLLERMRENPNALQALPNVIASAAQRKSLQVWSSTNELQDALNQVMPLDDVPEGDWLKIVNTNVGGKKSSRNVHQNVILEDRKRGNWRERTLTIRRTHHGTGIWPDDENRNYTEVYLPAGAEVIEQPKGKGGENLIANSKQRELGIYGYVFPGEIVPTSQWVKVGFWSTTSVAEQTEFILRYRIPNSTEFAGNFTYLKQAGARNETLNAFGYDSFVTQNLALEKRKTFW
jgi:hypothetical protein